MFPLKLLFLLLFPAVLSADVVKPALVEISVYSDGHYRVELRASLEALLSGINARYKNTTEAPTADEYDRFRKQDPMALAEAFRPFHARLLSEIDLLADGSKLQASIQDIRIPAAGYTKVPRISQIILVGKIPAHSEALVWYYPAAFGDNAVRVRQVDEVRELWHWSDWQWLRDDQPSEPFSLTEVFQQRTFAQQFVEYLYAGFDHIIPKGLDHILFIIGIFLLSSRLSPLLWQVTMFTLAHSITLGLSMYGVISLPASVVEPLIALSIAWIGIENIWHRELKSYRLAVVFAFGLLHGLGFASVLVDFGMPDSHFVAALLGFNLGVEVAQIAIILAGFIGLSYWFGQRHWYRSVVVVPASAMVALTGLVWTLERLEFGL